MSIDLTHWTTHSSSASQSRLKRPLGEGLGSESEEEETAAEKRLRLAKKYLSQLEEEGGNYGITSLLL